MNKDDFEAWAINTSDNFSRNNEGELTWFKFPFWLLDSACTKRVINYYKKNINKKSD